MNTQFSPRLIALAAGLMSLTLGLGSAYASTASPAPAPSAKKATAAPAGGVRQVYWQDLVPKGWMPEDAFKGIDLTKLEDADPKAEELRLKMQELAKKAPTNAAINGQRVKLPGYVVPLEFNKGEISEFLLVPYFGACIHTPPPPGNQIVHVRTEKPVKLRTMAAVWITGKLVIDGQETSMGYSSYRMQAEDVSPYQPPGR